MATLAGIALSLGLGLATAACGDKAPAGDDDSGQGAAAGAGGLGGAGGEGGMPPSACELRATELQAQLDTVHAEQNLLGGALIGVSTPDCGVWLGAAGESSMGVPMVTEDVLRVGSVTKTYVAATVLKLQSDGLLSLDDPVDMYVSGIPDGDQITIRMLLNHTAGLFDYVSDIDFLDQIAFDNTPITPQQLLDVAIAHPPLGEPGFQHRYSNTNYVVAGMVIETVTGQSLSAVIRDRVLSDGFTNTAFAGEEPLPKPLATGYSTLGSDHTNAYHPTLYYAAGAMASTIGDLVAWGEALYGGDVLTAAEQDLMVGDPVNAGAGTDYGLGVVLQSSYKFEFVSPALGHTGRVNGYAAEVLYLSERDTVIATMMNNFATDRDPYREAVLKTLYPESFE